ncbi:MAG: hypothetical protein LBM65_06100 [Oscillospiraceae bacterium]|jgi:hypothetical protein|nr:hypothetical protein [Oscillospiraceae bacterium]
MNYEITEFILDRISSFIDKKNVTVKTENTDWRGKTYISDLVILDEENNVGFEVFDDEITVFYFTAHTHFNKQYYEELELEYSDSIAIEFLIDLFTYPIHYTKVYKGKKLINEKYHIETDDYTGMRTIDSAWHGLVNFHNPFAKKVKENFIWSFNKETKCFEKQAVKQPTQKKKGVF